MNTMLRSLGPEPARVYWIRRLLIIAALIVAATLVWTLVQGGGTPSDAAAGSTSSSDEDAAEGEGDPPEGELDDATGASAPCTAENLELAVSTGRNSYPEDSRPAFTVTVTNTGEAGCTVDVGDASRELLITSGSDRIWSSLDCESENPSRNLLLGAGKSDTHDASWDRIRSDEKCSDGLPNPRPGTYKAQVKLNGAESAQATFSLE